ncbi:ATP-binding protein [Nocardia gamkensis]|uniref:ATP-binding protein n=1 Tax=Nocardia gamkensis TaxID=352869 RepID=UPI0037CAFC61
MLVADTSDHGDDGDLFGRETEIRELSDFLDRAATEGDARLLVGAPGVGKTRLLQTAAVMAADKGMRVLTAAGVQFEADISYSGLNQILMPVIDGLDQLSAPLRDALTVALGLGDGDPPRTLVVCNAALGLLTRAAVSRPIAVVIDDLPWLDRASAAALGFIARRAHGTRVCLLASFRTGEASLFERSGLLEVEVRPLSRADSSRLVARRHPNLSARARQRLLDEADGNPLALVELAYGLSRLGPDARGIPQVLPLTNKLKSSFAFRIADLPDRTRQALLVIALDGRRELGLLMRAGWGLEDVAPAEKTGFLAVDLTAMSVHFRHPLMRSAVVDQSTSEERRNAHRSIAENLGDEPERQAWHLAEAAVGPDEAIAGRLEQVARSALSRGDATAAINALTRAAQLSPGRHDHGRRLAEAAYLGADVTGELDSASQLLADARRVDPDAAGSLHAAAAVAYMLVNGDGDVDTAYRVLLGAIQSEGHDWCADNAELVEALSSLLLICWWAGNTDYWAPLYEAIGRLRPEPPELLLIQSRTFPDTARIRAGDRERLAALIARQDAEFEPNRIIRVNTSSVYVDLLGGCRAGAWRLIEDGRLGGAVRSGLGAYMHLLLDDFATGRWEEGQQLADEALAVCRENNYHFITYYFLFHQSLLAAVRGDADRAYQWADELTRVTTRRNAAGAERFGYHPRTLAAVGQGDWEAAYRYACRLSPAGQFAPYTPHALWVAFDLVEAAVRTGRRTEARAHVDAMVATNPTAISPRFALLTMGARALVAEGDEADRLFETALGMPDASEWPFDLARIQLAYGERLRRGLATARGREVLHLALSTFERLGAGPWAARTREELRAAGDARPKGGTSHVPEAALTAQERAIAELAAEGLTNKEIATRLFLSPRTVSGHLYRVFPKLGVTSRAALRDALTGSSSPDSST